MNILTALMSIKRTLEDLDIKATQANCDKLLGCMDTLDKIITTINKRKEEKANESDCERKEN